MKGKGLIRALVKRGSSKSKKRATPYVRDLTVCDRCAAVYLHRTWRKRRGLLRAFVAGPIWSTCPACKQLETGRYYGRVLIAGLRTADEDTLVRRRIANVAKRAATKQPERKVLSIEKRRDGLEVLTTSQKLAHRIATELGKVLGGPVRYHWDDQDGSLFATCEPRFSRAS